MSKTRVSTGYRDKMVFSELSRGGYVTADDAVALTN